MQFVFDDRQEHQVRAIDAITDLFEGQAYLDAAKAVNAASLLPVYENRLLIDDRRLLDNLQAVQGRNGIPQDTAVQRIDASIDTELGYVTASFPNFSVEMETGTGKTYVYVRAALELCRRFGFRKFVIIVPSVAVREGVVKTLKVTRPHFASLFHNAPYRFSEYDSADLGSVRAFAQSQGAEFLVMTLDSFNKASNILRQPQWRLQGQTPIHLLQATRPILLLDEPQNMESEVSVRSLAALHPLVALRFSATHRNPYNAIYRLTPFDALRDGLVKQIEVAGAVERGVASRVFLRLERTDGARRTVTARLTVHRVTKKGTVKEETITVRPADSLKDKTGNARYGELYIEEIGTRPMSAIISDGAGTRIELERGQTHGADRESIFAEQIRYTVREHFRKQRALKPRGIKVLSLFFIDRVDNYYPPGSVLRTRFETVFAELAKEFEEWSGVEPASAHRGYFAERRRNGIAQAVDTTGKSKEDEEAFELIMRNKEELLSFSSSVAFLFSHSALREGWDNPNVFQICTLNQTYSDVKKRQEIGRGMRLSVDQTGRRVTAANVNVLTVVTNETYEDYVRSLQEEIEEDYGKEGTPPKPRNARLKTTVTLRQAVVLSPEFKALWERIRQKTRYQVTIDAEALIQNAVQQLDAATIGRPHIEIAKAEIKVAETRDAFDAVEVGRTIRRGKVVGAGELPNLLDLMAYLLEYTTPPVRLTRRTLLEVFRRCGKQREAMDNLQEFATVAVRIIKSVLSEQLVDGIRYRKVDDWYNMEDMATAFERWADTLLEAGPKSPYDWVEVESGAERSFLAELKGSKEVELFLKLPAWFVVPTPVGEYNPDWAIVWQPRDAHGQPAGDAQLYLVAETKHTRDLTLLRLAERQKVHCAAQSFGTALNVPYDVAVTLQDVRALVRREQTAAS